MARSFGHPFVFLHSLRLGITFVFDNEEERNYPGNWQLEEAEDHHPEGEAGDDQSLRVRREDG